MLLVALRRTGAFGLYRWPLAGALTYPLFLLHQHIGYMIFNKLYPGINPHILFWSTIAAVLATALAVHVFIEKRFASPMKAALERVADRMEDWFRPRVLKA
jgi:peptidoglycan/LPS O-acetylase OafA/YrhL